MPGKDEDISRGVLRLVVPGIVRYILGIKEFCDIPKRIGMYKLARDLILDRESLLFWIL